MAVQVTSKFDEDPIKNERASLETPFSHYKFLDTQESDQKQSRKGGDIIICLLKI